MKNREKRIRDETINIARYFWTVRAIRSGTCGEGAGARSRMGWGKGRRHQQGATACSPPHFVRLSRRRSAGRFLQEMSESIQIRVPEANPSSTVDPPRDHPVPKEYDRGRDADGEPVPERVLPVRNVGDSQLARHGPSSPRKLWNKAPGGSTPASPEAHGIGTDPLEARPIEVRGFQHLEPHTFPHALHPRGPINLLSGRELGSL